ncbi:autophagy-related protein 9 [Rhodnius prolixus]
MMGTFEASYQQFGTDDSEDTPQGMIHIVPDCGKAAKWNHIEDLDSFFTRVYKYHQRHGFVCMMLQEVLELFQFIFVVIFSMFLLNCIDYPVLFKDQPLNSTSNAGGKLTISDVVYPTEVCLNRMTGLHWSVIIVAIVFWLLRAIKVLYHAFQYWDVKAFFNTALKINDCDLDNVTWHEVQKRLCEVQLEQQMCIHKRELSQLDIYHRILRFKNYMVAMVNKSLLPPRFKVPFLGEIVYLSHGLKYNIELLLFWGPWSPFENNWHLKEDYKKVSKRQELASLLSKHILYVAVVNLVLCPLILLWQILYSFFNYAEVLKREPGSLGVRCWSLYGRLYLRHFNELDHELNTRLNRAYRPATKYMNIFTSPVMTVLAKNVVFVSGACLAVLLVLSIYDEDVLTVEHVLSAITILGAVVACFRALIPDEHLVWWPEHLMNAVLAHVHYLPSHWRGHAHTHSVRNEFTQLFQYRATYLLGEMVSPIVTPLVLIFYLRSRALDLVDFYRSFTVQVAGVGDVCSFAQMDVRTHGDPAWNQLGPTTWSSGDAPAEQPTPAPYVQAEEGKIELSLIHFTLTNPEWNPPNECGGFVNGIKEQAKRQLLQDIPITVSDDQSLGSVAAGMSTLLARMGVVESSVYQVSRPQVTTTLGTSQPPSMHHTHASRTEGPILDRHYLHGGFGGGCVLGAPSLGASVFGLNEPTLLGNADPIETTAMDMSINALYLHQVHQRAVQRRGGDRSTSARPGGSSYSHERLPLLRSPNHLS